MDKNRAKRKRWMRRKRGIRKRVFGTPERPRMTVFRSNTHIYAQIIDDVRGRTIVAASSVKLERGANTEAAARVGTQLAERARASGIERVAFDRNGYRYHGRVKALADAARGQGLSF